MPESIPEVMNTTILILKVLFSIITKEQNMAKVVIDSKNTQI